MIAREPARSGPAAREGDGGQSHLPAGLLHRSLAGEPAAAGGVRGRADRASPMALNTSSAMRPTSNSCGIGCASSSATMSSPAPSAASTSGPGKPCRAVGPPTRRAAVFMCRAGRRWSASGGSEQPSGRSDAPYLLGTGADDHRAALIRSVSSRASASSRRG